MSLLVVLSHVCQAEDLIAVNVALAIPERLKEKVIEINSILVANTPQSFHLDLSHFPHVTILQMFIRPKDLERLIQKISEIKNTGFILKEKNIGFSKINKFPHLSLLSMFFYKNDDLTHFQKELIDATESIRVFKGTKKAFYDSHEMDKQFVKYVQTYVKKDTGRHYKPHVSLGLAANKKYERSILKWEGEYYFDEILVVQLGNYGTAREVLKVIQLRTAPNPFLQSQ